MTKRIGNVLIIEPEPAQRCDECGKIDELRPYGKDGALICFECGQKNPCQTLINMSLFMFGEEPTEEEYKSRGL